MQRNYIKNAEETWNSIAKSFDATRRKPWKECIEFIKNLPKSSLVADIGCGNGRHLIPCSKHCKKVIGIDISKEFLTITENKINNEKLENIILIHSNVLNIPLKDCSVDSVLYIATLHNIKGKKQRIQSLKEIRRILNNDGKALISVWSRWQDKFRKEFFKKWLIQCGQNEFGDINIYWKQHGLNIPRFYHLYSKREFLNDINQAGLDIFDFKELKLHSKKYPDNFFAIVKKNNKLLSKIQFNYFIKYSPFSFNNL